MRMPSPGVTTGPGTLNVGSLAQHRADRIIPIPFRAKRRLRHDFEGDPTSGPWAAPRRPPVDLQAMRPQSRPPWMLPEDALRLTRHSWVALGRQRAERWAGHVGDSHRPETQQRCVAAKDGPQARLRFPRAKQLWFWCKPAPRWRKSSGRQHSEPKAVDRSHTVDVFSRHVADRRTRPTGCPTDRSPARPRDATLGVASAEWAAQGRRNPTIDLLP